MKAHRFTAATIALAFACPTTAALPPNAQRAAELRAILDDYAVAGAFPADQQITRIEYISPDRYRVSSASCAMDVRLVGKAMPRGMVGPRAFGVQAGEVICTRR